MDLDISQPLDPTLLVPYVPKPVVICLYRSIQSTSLSLLREYGKVVEFGPAYTNVPVTSFPFDYLILDLREEDHRFYYQRYIFRNHTNYHLILYRYSFETSNGIYFHNEITEFPSLQVSKDEFDMVLLESPLPAPPSCLVSLCRYFFK